MKLPVVKEIVRGCTRIAFKNDRGEDVEAGTVFVDVSLDKEGQGYGYRTEGMKCKDLAVIDRIKHNPFPLMAELSIEMQATGKNTRLVILDIKPLSRVDGSPLPKIDASKVAA
jgi:hypothetical protein